MQNCELYLCSVWLMSDLSLLKLLVFEIGSYFFVFVMMWFVFEFWLFGGMFVGLFVYQLIYMIVFVIECYIISMCVCWVVVVLLLIVIVGVFIGLMIGIIEYFEYMVLNLQSLFDQLMQIVEQICVCMLVWIVNLLFVDVEQMKMKVVVLMYLYMDQFQ